MLTLWVLRIHYVGRDTGQFGGGHALVGGRPHAIIARADEPDGGIGGVDRQCGLVSPVVSIIRWHKERREAVDARP